MSWNSFGSSIPAVCLPRSGGQDNLSKGAGVERSDAAPATSWGLTSFVPSHPSLSVERGPDRDRPAAKRQVELGPSNLLEFRRERPIPRFAGPHGCGSQRRIGEVITANVDRPSLHFVQFGDDDLLLLRQRLRQGRETSLQLRVLILSGQGACPVQRQIKMAAAVVQLMHFARWRLAVVEQVTDCLRVGGRSSRTLASPARSSRSVSHRASAQSLPANRAR